MLLTLLLVVSVVIAAVLLAAALRAPVVRVARSGRSVTYDWKGNRNGGSGCMTIIDNHVAEHIGIKLEFLKPMPGIRRAEFQFEPRGNTTAVTWSMAGTGNFVCRVFSLFPSTDKMLG